MPSALAASRDFLARGVAGVRSGLRRIDESANSPGPDLHVEPFDATNVSTAAGLVKLGAAIRAAQRRKANAAVEAKDAELAREKTREEIARIRAQTQYYLGEGRQPAGPQRTTIPIGEFPPGTPVADVNAGLRNRGLEASARNQEEIRKSRGRVAAAKSGISQIDADVKREAQDWTTTAMQEVDQLIAQVRSGDDKARNAALARLEIDADQFKEAYPVERFRLLEGARASFKSRINDLATKEFRGQRAGDRAKYQEVIDRGVEGFSPELDNPAGLDLSDLGIE
jgi:hypothetical protein